MSKDCLQVCHCSATSTREKPISAIPQAGAMARVSSVASRNLSLTEELEKLEQSITLTLQGLFTPPGRH